VRLNVLSSIGSNGAVTPHEVEDVLARGCGWSIFALLGLLLFVCRRCLWLLDLLLSFTLLWSRAEAGQLGSLELLESDFAIGPLVLLLDKSNDFVEREAPTELRNLGLVVLETLGDEVLDLLFSNNNTNTTSSVEFSLIDDVQVTLLIQLRLDMLDGLSHLELFDPLILHDVIDKCFRVLVLGRWQNCRELVQELTLWLGSFSTSDLYHTGESCDEFRVLQQSLDDFIVKTNCG
jgi:hypothetical protein